MSNTHVNWDRKKLISSKKSIVNIYHVHPAQVLYALLFHASGDLPTAIRHSIVAGQ